MYRLLLNASTFCNALVYGAELLQLGLARPRIGFDYLKFMNQAFGYGIECLLRQGVALDVKVLNYWRRDEDSRPKVSNHANPPPDLPRPRQAVFRRSAGDGSLLRRRRAARRDNLSLGELYLEAHGA